MTSSPEERSITEQAAWFPVTFPLSPAASYQVVVFSHWLEARNHICKHVLSQPESFAWPIAEPMLCMIVGALQTECRPQWRRWSEQMEVSETFWEEIYRIYAAQIAAAYSDAYRNHWCVTAEGRVIGFGLVGLLFVLKAARSIRVQTGFFPGWGVSRFGRNADALAQRLDAACSDDWSPQQRIYHVLFRPTIRFLLKKAAMEIPDSRPGSVDYRALYMQAEVASQLSFEQWEALRSTNDEGVRNAD